MSDTLSDAECRQAAKIFNAAARMSNRIMELLEDAQIAPSEDVSMALVIIAVQTAKDNCIPESAFLGMVHACWALARAEAPIAPPTEDA